MTTGDICWVELPAANGHEQGGRRPALIVQDAKGGRGLATMLVIPLTTVEAARRFQATIEVQATAENGLRHDSVALIFQLRAVDRRRLGERLGALSAPVLSGIFKALDELMGRTDSA